MGKKNYKLTIFDFDGTLADTATCILKTLHATLDKLNLPQRNDDEIRSTIGLPLERSFQLLTHGDMVLIEDCCRVYRELFFSFQEQTICLFPHVKETLDEIRKSGLTIAIATSRGGESLGTLCKQLEIDEFISMRMSSNLVNEKKPAPEMVNRILDYFNIAPNKTLVIGDANYDIEMGKRAYCDTCAVTYGNQTREELLTMAPTFMIDDIRDILSILKN